MAITVSCPTCGLVSSLAEEQADQVVACRGCQAPYRVPGLPTTPAESLPYAEPDLTPEESMPYAEPDTFDYAMADVFGETAPAAPPPPPRPLQPAFDYTPGDALLEVLPAVEELEPTVSCTEHRRVAVAASCADCERPFCGDCLVRLQGETLCAVCKNQRVKQLQRTREAASTAYAALITALPSLLFICLGLAAGPIAVILGFMGLAAVERNPWLKGRSWALSGICLGFYGFLISAVMLLAIMMQMP